jgi:CRP-like cAMP-binding protein
MAYKSNNERFIDVILDLNKKYGVKDGMDSKIDISLSRHDLASLTGTSVETIVRVLAWLKEKGAVKTHKKYIYISDLQVLQEMAPEY